MIYSHVGNLKYYAKKLTTQIKYQKIIRLTI